MAAELDLDDDAERRRARATQLLEGANSEEQPEPARPDSGKPAPRPVIDMTGPRLRLFAKSGEFPRAEHE